MTGWSMADRVLDEAVSGLRGGDVVRLRDVIAVRLGAAARSVERLLMDEDDLPPAILCRAADLPWDTFEAVLLFRARRHGKAPSLLTRSMRAYRDTTVDGARRKAAALGWVDA